MEHFFGSSPVLNISDDIISDDFKSGMFKCRIVYDREILSIDYIPYTFRTINRLVVMVNNDIDYTYKWENRDELKKMMERKGEFDDILIVKNGMVTDVSSANVVFEDESGFYTPNTYLLNGTKRQSLLNRGIITEREIGVDDIYSYSKLYYINAMIDLEDNRYVPTTSILKE